MNMAHREMSPMLAAWIPGPTNVRVLSRSSLQSQVLPNPFNRLFRLTLARVLLKLKAYMTTKISSPLQEQVQAPPGEKRALAGMHYILRAEFPTSLSRQVQPKAKGSLC